MLLTSLEYPYNAIMLAHAGEIGIKSKTTRRFMIKQLYKNISKKFPDYNLIFKNIANRSIVEIDEPEKLAQRIAENIFGISYTSPIYFFKWLDHEHLTSVVTKYASQYLKPGMSFGFDAKTTGKNRPSSQSLKVELGSLVFESYNGSLTVNLNNPDFYFTVEVREEYAWVYHKKFHGLDGFPQGAQQGMAFGNIRPWTPDYIATFQTMKRGVNVKPVRFLTQKVIPPEQESWHQQFLEKFVFRKCLDIPIYDLLISWEKLFGQKLCSACIFFSEQLLTKASEDKKNIGFVSGLQLDTLGGDITPAALQWLENNSKAFKIRPNIASDITGILDNHYFKDFAKKASCCKFQAVRKIDSSLDDKEKTIILKEVQNYYKQFFNASSESYENSKNSIVRNK